MIDEFFGRVFPEITGAEMHLLVVNDLPADGSPDDGTGSIVKGKMEKYKNLHILEDKKQGLGWAYIRGFKYVVVNLGLKFSVNTPYKLLYVASMPAPFPTTDVICFTDKTQLPEGIKINWLAQMPPMIDNNVDKVLETLSINNSTTKSLAGL